MTSSTRTPFVLLVFALVLPSSCTSLAESVDAKPNDLVVGVASVIDADTLEIHGQRIRLWGIDAPESGQACTVEGQPWRCGAAAANVLDTHLARRTVSCQGVDRDRWKRLVARCFVADQDLNAWLVREGWALDYARYSKGVFAQDEAAAREQRLGVWKSQFEAPWEWRRRAR